jgi:tripartite-type tricarboxylate transporter receptor subunit TctC
MKTTGSVRVALAFALALTCAAGAVRAQVTGYPDRPIKLLVGFGAGGGTDIVARILAPKISNSLANRSLWRTAPARAA